MSQWILRRQAYMQQEVENSLPPATSLIRIAKQAQRIRPTLAKAFPPSLLLDASWDIMLELYLARQDDKTLCVKHLILASGENSTTALRRIDRLERAGLIHRKQDFEDNRRISVELTAHGEEAMESLLKHFAAA